jgi:hypothetical protein
MKSDLNRQRMLFNFFLFFVTISLSSSLSITQSTPLLADPTSSYITAQEFLSLSSPIPFAFQIATDGSLPLTLSAESNTPLDIIEGDTIPPHHYSLLHQLKLGVRSFHFPIASIALSPNSPFTLHVCGVTLTPAQMQKWCPPTEARRQNTRPGHCKSSSSLLPFHFCSQTSPLFSDVLVILRNWALFTHSPLTIRFTLLNENDERAQNELENVVSEIIGEWVMQREMEGESKDKWPTWADVNQKGKYFILFG